MRIAFAGSNYCEQYDPVPAPHESVWLPLAATLAGMFGQAGVEAEWADVLVIVLAETSPLPVDIEDCPCPTVGIVVDWETWSDALFAHAPGLDVILADQSGVDKMSPLLPGKLKTFVPVGNFGRIDSGLSKAPIAARAWDVTFVGGLLPAERFAGRVEGLRHLYPLCDRFKVRVLAKMDRDDFIAAMCDSKILFNHAALPIQQGINARNFEAGACRAVVMGERDNGALREFFADDELLFYDYDTIGDSVSRALSDPERAQRMADRYADKVTAPLMPRLLATLQDIIDAGTRTRAARTIYDVLIGLVCGFGNWGDAAQRMPHTLDMILQTARIAVQEHPQDATLRNLVGVAIAEVARELQRLGHPDDARKVREHADLAPVTHWQRAARLDGTFGPPLYNLGRHFAETGDFSRATDFLQRGRQCLMAHRGAAVARPALLYPVWAPLAAGLDRTLAASYNAVRFRHADEEARADARASILLWRVEECLGDLAHRRGSRQEARCHYVAAAECAPELSTEALRKAVALSDDATLTSALLEKLTRLNPLDLPFREQLRDAYAREGRTDATLNEEIRLLGKAVLTPRAFERPPLDVI